MDSHKTAGISRRISKLGLVLRTVEVRRAFLESLARHLRSRIRKLALADRAEWIQGRVLDVAVNIEKGRSASLWKLALDLGRRRRRIVTGVGVLKDF